ncbi:hypothetical protein QNK09_12020 [Brevibacillus agri]|uniref:hypothetical protein n=1 Tax=Brevibacillus agri TaxID=51101 RepID=UPI0009DFBC2B|nr:hypothetical protein [Brevibacillus agri]WHX32881.1 hypothetical protein QNK09_12020 [Brevibacillus agri]
MAKTLENKGSIECGCNNNVLYNINIATTPPNASNIKGFDVLDSKIPLKKIKMYWEYEPMEKSFYYVVPSKDVFRYINELNAQGIPHEVETRSMQDELNVGEVSIVFPDLPVRQFGVVFDLFGDAGKKY